MCRSGSGGRAGSLLPLWMNFVPRQFRQKCRRPPMRRGKLRYGRKRRGRWMLTPTPSTNLARGHIPALNPRSLLPPRCRLRREAFFSHSAASWCVRPSPVYSFAQSLAVAAMSSVGGLFESTKVPCLTSFQESVRNFECPRGLFNKFSL